jgi:hypothetical protein
LKWKKAVEVRIPRLPGIKEDAVRDCRLKGKDEENNEKFSGREQSFYKSLTHNMK